MRDDDVLDIINLCIAINQRATEIYLMLSVADKNEELKLFWSEMAREEKAHATFWVTAKEAAEVYKLPHVFDNPLAIKNELVQILTKVKVLLNRWELNQTRENALILAYRLEYNMLHPAFDLLYHSLKPTKEGPESDDVYDQHINRFIKMFIHYGNMSPELELLGETLKSLWERNKTLTRLVMIDELTNLLNRRGFLILAKELLYLAQRNKESMGLLMIDIDKFKKVNDKFGHQKGDEVLKGVAISLKKSVRKSDIVGRFGGEEFIILFPAILPIALERISEKIRLGVEKARPDDIPITISIGVKHGILEGDPDIELFSWISKADNCLYQAKANGRNCVVFDT